MTDITEFLRARLGEYEHVARCVLEAEPKSSAPIFTSLHAPTGTVEMSPARVLAEVAAMRRMLDLRYSWALQIDKAPEQVRHVFEAEVNAADAIILGFAAIWRDHEAYDPAWAPEGG